MESFNTSGKRSIGHTRRAIQGGHDPLTNEHIVQSKAKGEYGVGNAYDTAMADILRVLQSRANSNARTGTIIISCFGGGQVEEVAKAFAMSTMSLAHKVDLVRTEDADKMLDLISRHVSEGDVSYLHSEKVFEGCLKYVSRFNNVPTMFTPGRNDPTH